MEKCMSLAWHLLKFLLVIEIITEFNAMIVLIILMRNKFMFLNRKKWCLILISNKFGAINYLCMQDINAGNASASHKKKYALVENLWKRL